MKTLIMKITMMIFITPVVFAGSIDWTLPTQLGPIMIPGIPMMFTLY